MIMKKTFILLAFLIATINIAAQNNISIKDFKILDNTTWEGNLTYKNYSDGKQVSIPTTTQFSITEKAIETSLQYTYEPDRNIKSKTRINKNGRFLGNEEVVDKVVQPNGSFKITTRYEGKDDNKKALIFMTYQLNDDEYSVTKEVQFMDTEERFVRHKYQYTKI